MLVRLWCLVRAVPELNEAHSDQCVIACTKRRKGAVHVRDTVRYRPQESERQLAKSQPWGLRERAGRLGNERRPGAGERRGTYPHIWTQNYFRQNQRRRNIPLEYCKELAKEKQHTKELANPFDSTRVLGKK